MTRMKRGAIVRRVTVTFEGATEDYPTWIHGEDGLVWRVRAIITYWQHPDLGRYRLVPGHHGEAIRWRLTVVGPVPGDPERVGEQTVILRTHGEGMSWYMSPG
jgi:hypothetical protein